MIGTLLGKYKLQQLLGAGGMGAVYLGEHVVLKQLRAVKVLHPEHTKDPQLVARFIGEARTVAAIKNRNVAAIDDIGQLESGLCYMVLEHLEGGTLGGFIRSHGGPIALPSIVKIVGQIANALQAAHDRGVVHRDLKPENVYLTHGDEMRVVVLDWGIALIAQELRTGSVTRTGSLLGTPQYMAPEQHRGERVGPAVDIYALGVILYELLTGGWLPYLDGHSRKETFLELTPSEIYLRQMTRPPFDPRRRVPGLGDELTALVLAALERDPARRPASPRAFALRLAELVPSTGRHPDGLEILRDVARPLLDAGPPHDPHRAAPAIAASSKLHATRYQLGEKLGEGGMAEVFAGTVAGAEGFQRQVAIKRVMPGLSGDADFARMFVEEARIMARLDHPNIVGVLAFDRDPEGRLFLVMEYIDGRDLAALAATGRLPIAVTIFILVEILQGLGYAHDFPDPTGAIHGVVHRDMSPHNVLLAWTGAVKVSDFGIAKVFAESGGARSITVKVKPQYMSPEQINADSLDGRSDLFAVGVIAHELLTGRSLFSGSPGELLAQVMFRDIPRPSSVHPDIAADVEAVVMRLLERDRGRRYPSAEQAIEELARCADAPRNGRRELARLLAERFPDLAKARAKRTQESAPATASTARAATQDPAPSRLQAPAPTPVPTPAPILSSTQAPVPVPVPPSAPFAAPVPPSGQARIAMQLPIPVLPSTLGSSASQLERRPAEPRLRRRMWTAMGCGVALGCIIGASIWTADGGAEPRAGDTIAEAAGPDAASLDAARPSDSPALPVRIDVALDAAALDAVPLDAAPLDDEIEIQPSEDAGAPMDAGVARPTAQGELGIYIDPYAEVWLDGVSLGSTPIRKKVSIGRHSLVLVNKDLNVRKTVTVTITAGKTLQHEEKW
jgi:serine/threonine-protein kinase